MLLENKTLTKQKEKSYKKTEQSKFGLIKISLLGKVEMWRIFS